MHSRLPRGVRPRLEGKPRTPLSSRVATRVSWRPLSGLKGVQPPLPFGERTRDWSPGHAGKEGPQLSSTGPSQGFPRAAAHVGVFSRGTTRIFHLTASKPFSSDGKASACNVGDLGLIPGSGRSPGEGNGNPLEYSCLGNSMDGGTWWPTVHRVAKSRTRLSNFTSLHFNLLDNFCQY